MQKYSKDVRFNTASYLQYAKNPSLLYSSWIIKSVQKSVHLEKKKSFCFKNVKRYF